MITTLFLGLLSASAGGHAPHHNMTIEHRGVPVSVAYRANTTLSTRQVGMAAPTRMGVVRCNWTAKIAVERSLARDGAAAANRVVSEGFELKGSRPGTCSGAKKAIQQELAKRDDEVRAHVLAIAERDQESLRAELETASPGAS
jgi:hypothetical protein